MYGLVKVWQETISLPTWTTGGEDPNPMFLEKRVYQGSSGGVYPYGVIDTLTGEREMRDYQAVWMENDFIRIMLLPELGGRIHRAYDKVKQRDFVYYNDVVKPALVGLLGPWISGGIEFNWPQHHRPTTFMPVDFSIQQREGGVQTVWMGEVEPMRGLQVMSGFTLYPDRALIEITGKVFNGNSTPRHFLWWANPAVKGGDAHQSVFPPDVTAVFDHGKRDVSAFPIATGTYYKVDYSAGVDISRYKNVPVPTSYMAEKSDYDFVGAYHHEERGGLLHVADHHVSPGKKQWSWGYDDFGQAWDRNLTDENGPYIELMTGVFTDNQPDFTWIAPYEEKVFVQNFLPYSELGMVQNANTQLALKLVRESKKLLVGVYAIAPLEKIVVELIADNQPIYETQLTLRPGESWQHTLPENSAQRLTINVKTAEGKLLLDYQEHITHQTPLPEPASAPAMPEAIHNCDELYFIGQHLEQYNHASRYAADYYRRAIALDPQDYRNNVALGTLAFNRADWVVAEQCSRAALLRAHRLNKNPRDGEASMLLASALERQGDEAGAWDHYYKASWSGNCRDAAWWSLARLAMKRGDIADALEKVNTSLQFNASNHWAMGLKALALAKSAHSREAQDYIFTCLEQYPLSYPLHCVRWMIEPSDEARASLLHVTGRRGVNGSLLAGWLLSIGQKQAASEILEVLDCQEALPMLWRASLSDDAKTRAQFIVAAQQCHARKVRFPNTLDEVQMLQTLSDSAFARYLLGCFWYSKRRYEDAVVCWRETLEKSPDFAPVHRLMGVYAWNKQHNATQALAYLQRAVELEPENARFLFELDFLKKTLGRATSERLETLVACKNVVLKRDDLTAELLSLWNGGGHYDDAASILGTRVFHPWEGGEGKITGQYLLNQLHQALQSIERQMFTPAAQYLTDALCYPHNLGEGRLPGQTDNDIWYLLGYCAEQAGDLPQAATYYQRAQQGSSTLDAGRYYNDQPVDYLFWQGMALRKSGHTAQAEQHFRNFITWAERHRDDVPEADFFAVSLPDLVVLDVSAPQLHHQHCLFIEMLGYLGLGERSASQKAMQQLLKMNPAHDKAHLIRHAMQSGIFF
jgi:tetratricopeptide (TPR) repeat protein